MIGNLLLHTNNQTSRYPASNGIMADVCRPDLKSIGTAGVIVKTVIAVVYITNVPIFSFIYL